MPEYFNRPCEGMCERHGYPCQRTKFYIDAADERSAQPIQFSQKQNYGTKEEVEWYFWALKVPKEQQGLAFDDIKTHSPALVFENGTILPYWLKEFPCHSGCDIMICYACKKAHVKSAVIDGVCQIYEQAEAKRKADEIARQKLLKANPPVTTHPAKTAATKYTGKYKASTWAETQEEYARPKIHRSPASTSMPLLSAVNKIMKESLNGANEELSEEENDRANAAINGVENETDDARTGTQTAATDDTVGAGEQDS